MADAAKSVGPGIWAQVMRAKPAKPGEIYGVPGQGDSLVVSGVVIAALIFVWWFITQMGWIKPLFLPSPKEVVHSFRDLLDNGFTGSSFWEHTWISTARVFGAFVLACVIGIPLGIAMGVSPLARGIFDPPIEFYRPIPPLAYLPLMIIWFGIDELSKILLIYLAIFAPMAISARAGVRSVGIEQIHAAYAMGASRLQIIWHVVLPAATPEILTGMRIGIGFGWTTLVAAEMVAATRGLGFMVLNAAQYLQSDTVIMGIIVIGLFAFAFDLLMRHLEKVLVPWKGRV